MNIHNRWVAGKPANTPAERMYAVARAALSAMPEADAYWHDVMAWAFAAEGAELVWIRCHWRQACALRGYCPI